MVHIKKKKSCPESRWELRSHKPGSEVKKKKKENKNKTGNEKGAFCYIFD